METQVVNRTVLWVEQSFGDRFTKDELMRKLQGADLPAEAKATLASLAEGTHIKHEVIETLRDRITDQGVVGAHHGGTG